MNFLKQEARELRKGGSRPARHWTAGRWGLVKIARRVTRKFLDFHSGRVPCLAGHPFTSPRGLTVTHISAFSHDNAGDLFLPVALRNLFNDNIPVKEWIGRHVHEVVSKGDVKRFGKSDFIVIGGGGLFLADTNPNELSGWQWSCGMDNLRDIQAPLIAFAIGYNRFRGQKEFAPIFTEHLNAFVEKAVFVGIRNHGSIRKLREYLRTEELRDKLVFQPCMTTLTSLLYKDLCDYGKKEDFIAFNCAFDRQELRRNDEAVLAQIADVALRLSNHAGIRYYSHMPSDEKVLPFFDKVGVEYQLVRLRDVRQTIMEYARPRLVIGMRGHAQMIPFGCNTPILSVISHDKMQWFLDDIHHPEWGVDVLDSSFGSRLYTKAKALFESTEELIPVLKEEQRYLWDITRKNMDEIKSTIKRLAK